MPELKLFVAPNTCARVPTIALEEIGEPFETELIRTAAKQQNSPEYLAINPKGKVPALLIDGEPLTENVAILRWLNQTYPDANLLPATSDDLEAARQYKVSAEEKERRELENSRWGRRTKRRGPRPLI